MSPDDTISKVRQIIDKADRLRLAISEDGHLFQINSVMLNGDYDSLPSISQEELFSIPPDIVKQLEEECKKKFGGS